MDLSDALGPDGGAPAQGGGTTWPSAPAGGGAWPSGPGGGAWPSAGGGPAGPGGGAWPSAGGGPAGPGGGAWPSAGGGQAGPGGGAWPSAAAGGGAWPSAAAGGTWPSGGGGAGGGTWPTQPNQPNQPNQPSAPGGWPAPSSGGRGEPTGSNNLNKQMLPNGIYNKLLITIAGKIKPNAQKITVDLNRAKDVAFHFNPRFNDNGRKVVVRNSCIGTKWGREERELSHFPFTQGGDFEIKILCTNNEFRVAVNGGHLLEFRHRITDLRSINQLHIYNDLTLSKVTFETLP